ncbi:hypothetical protein QJS04_geneDACA002780 [Acorus gramineus]|uniref:Uncharacterized protein n=1 Tax=Acorus gramineus TaxID=55184 RepID=A0AAV9BYQ0_ACOGR|nr:hypothetical protein QJS04_geneDACA002780 [Acorus gramineus]
MSHGEVRLPWTPTRAAPANNAEIRRDPTELRKKMMVRTTSPPRVPRSEKVRPRRVQAVTKAVVIGEGGFICPGKEYADLYPKAEKTFTLVSRAFHPPPVVDNVSPYSSIENIAVQKLTPEYKIGMERLVKSKAPPMKASELWKDKPALLLRLWVKGKVVQKKPLTPV